MADIFISYSRRDSEQALSLAERLRAAGMTVWIDQHGIEAATSWSKEIVDAIESSKAFVILLSRSSLLSENVVKELSIASEAHRPIVPVELETVTIPSEFKYQLAGLQRAQYSDFDSILRALAKLGIAMKTDGQATQPLLRPQIQNYSSASRERRKYFIGIAFLLLVLAIGAYFMVFSKKSKGTNTGVKTLAVLPFESLSSDKENDFFADGMTATLIDMLVPIPELRVVDRKTSMEFKASKQDMKSIAAAIGARYLVDGSIQRQGNTLKINIQMTDVEAGRVLFSKSFDGQTTDFLKLQEQIAKNIVVELQLAFNPNGLPMPPDAITSNPEAYNLCMKADYVEDRNEFDSCISFFLQATKLDTLYAYPYLSIARVYGNIYINRGRSDSILSLANSFFVVGKRLDTAQTYSHFVGSWLATVHNDFDRAIKEAMIFREKRPEDRRAYRLLGLAYLQSKRYNLAVDNFIEDMKRAPMDKDDMHILLFSLWCARDTVRLRQYATQAINLFESYLTRHPDDAPVSNNSLPLALVFSGRGDEACKRMEDLVRSTSSDPQYLMPAAAIHSLSNKPIRAIELLKMHIAKVGIRNVDFTGPFLDNIRSMPEFQALVKEKAEKMKNNG